MNDRQASTQRLHFTDLAACQDEELTLWLIMEDTGINTALRSLSQQLGFSGLLQKVQTTATIKQTNCRSSAWCQSTSIQGTMRADQTSIFKKKKCPTKRQKSIHVPGAKQLTKITPHHSHCSPSPASSAERAVRLADLRHLQRRGSQPSLLSIWTAPLTHAAAAAGQAQATTKYSEHSKTDWLQALATLMQQLTHTQQQPDLHKSWSPVIGCYRRWSEWC